jgi:hypothetical protein
MIKYRIIRKPYPDEKNATLLTPLLQNDSKAMPPPVTPSVFSGNKDA